MAAPIIPTPLRPRHVDSVSLFPSARFGRTGRVRPTDPLFPHPSQVDAATVVGIAYGITVRMAVQGRYVTQTDGHCH
jgi:hypothetical protein